MLTVVDRLFCRSMRIWIVPRAEGAYVPVPSFLHALFNAHIDRCVRCRAELKHLRLTTLELRRVSLAQTNKSFDPNFADRVMNRVRRDQDIRRQVAAHRKVALAVAAGMSALFVMISSLSGFNPLKAEWATQNTDRRIHKSAAVPAVSPFLDHDPFSYSGAQLSITSDLKPSSTRANSGIPTVVTRPAIPDELSSLHASSATTPVPASAMNVPLVPPVAETPASGNPQLASPSYQQITTRTPPGIISSAAADNEAPAVAPAAMDPNGSAAASAVSNGVIRAVTPPILAEPSAITGKMLPVGAVLPPAGKSSILTLSPDQR